MCSLQERRPAAENSLRILTAVINGMRHWGQFKDKVSILFEIFGQFFASWSHLLYTYVWQKENVCAFSAATLDSAVTLGRYGAKNFLLRDRKEVVQCVFYENVSLRGQTFSREVKQLTGSCISVEDINE